MRSKFLSTEVVETIHGHSLVAFENDHITNKIKKKGIYEGMPLFLVSQILRTIPDAVVLDVGANIGNHALYFSLNAHRVFAFEPVKEIYDVLEGNIEKNCIENVKCFNLGLSNRNTVSEMHINRGGNIGMSSLDRQAEGAYVTNVHLVRGDSWAKLYSREFEKIDLVKIDVEGHEANVLEGLRDTLSEHRPLVMLEWNDTQQADAFNDMNIFEDILTGCHVFVLGNNYDPEYWEGRFAAWAGRFIVRTFMKRTPRLYRFNPDRKYHNVLVVPNEKLSLVPSEAMK